MLKTRYFDRLGLVETDLDSNPTAENLSKLIEAHVTKIPFDNLAQHGAVGGPATLDMETTAQKLLDRNRGGFCFELNGLLGEFLTQLGYKVLRAPSYIFAPDLSDFRDYPTHVVLIVTVPHDDTKWYVDVGLGEPPMQPLRLEMDTPQVTVEGMESRFVQDGENIVLQWKKSGAEWAPRLKWNREDGLRDPGPSLNDFQDNLDYVHGDHCIFAQKLVVCLLSRTRKITLAGRRLKITTPRFGPESQSTYQIVETATEAREILYREFGMPLEETKGLDLQKSASAGKEIWESM
eukprot:CAMPEP_0116542976 /NCGR_PEP_ID=MMETSP0397-20121206/1305_1 /TAXON_ID=216820 /ORGANISM="Cyclophora tenuis, Strain ECT3854" /LENGTH=291 /DNA_ID=CAMNT_0004067025 /DNA_START=107 /DNA_END=982 /DNA_ORIENTATION=+